MFRNVVVERHRVTGCRVVRIPGARGVVFDSPDGDYDSVVFWTRDTDGVLAELADRGWPVSLDETVQSDF